MSSAQQDKAALRNSIKKILSTIDAHNVAEQSNQVTRKVLELPEFKSAASISIFLSMPNKEISTRDVVVKALEQDKKVFIPYIHADFPKSKSKVMDMLRLRDRKDLDALEPDAWGIPSLPPDGVEGRENALGGRGVRGPTSDTAECCLDLIFMPALAFDVEANRLGHGKGFYDKYISRLPDRPRLVGLALREQILAGGQLVPMTEYDHKVDRVVTAD